MKDLGSYPLWVGDPETLHGTCREGCGTQKNSINTNSQLVTAGLMSSKN